MAARLTINKCWRVLLACGCTPIVFSCVQASAQPTAADLKLKLSADGNSITAHQSGLSDAIITQQAKPGFRPYLHPIQAPDGKGTLTELSPGHHKHQTGLFWGFTRLNGRDYFHNPNATHWKRQKIEIVQAQGKSVSWRTVYDLLDAKGASILTETQTWKLNAKDGVHTLNLQWQGKAHRQVTVDKYNYGGLFLRMPWRKGIKAEALNSSGARNLNIEGKKSVWLDVGMKVDGRNDMAHISIFDHPRNQGYPHRWRVDKQFGFGPCRARSGCWKIAKGKTETIYHQILVHAGQLSSSALTQRWVDYSGDPKHARILWSLDQAQARDAKFLNPQQAVDTMTVMDGFRVNAYAAEPMITQPMAFCWDDKGRLWIAENRDYESRQKGFSHSGDSRILILEDTDRDGVADSCKVFAEGIPFPAGIAVGFDGLWLGTPPNLLFVPDRNSDDKADMEDIEVRLTGWGIRDRHETLNSFHWGPDGWLYGCQGFATPSKVGKPKGAGKLYMHRDPFPQKIEYDGRPVDINGGVWRYHPIKDRFEVVAHGFSNPWGIDYDAKGNFFITACVIPHMFHVIPGGIYHRQGGRHFNSYVYEDIRTIVDHNHRSAHGGARIYLSDAFPEEHHGNIFMCNIHEHAVLSDYLKVNGSGFIASHGPDLMRANNAQWVGFSKELGPDGALYALDWHDGDICGKEVLHKETGRVYRLSPIQSHAETWPERYADLSKQSDLHLAQLQTRLSSWHARRARVILQQRAVQKPIGTDAIDMLREIYVSHDNPNYRLRGMWALHVTSNLNDRQLISALSDQDEYIRAWAIQMLTEDFNASAAALQRFEEMAKSESSPVVRLRLASALQRVKLATRWMLAEHLVTHEADANDHNIPKMLWFGIEPLVAKDSQRALELATRSKIPLVTQFIARRAADADAFDALANSIARMDNTTKLTHILKGMRDGMDGRVHVQAPASWKNQHERLSGFGGEWKQLASEISQIFGLVSATKETLTLALDQKADAAARNKAIQTLASQQNEALEKALPKLFRDQAVEVAAIRAITSYDNKTAGKALLAHYSNLSDLGKRETVQALASRPSYGWQLTTAIRDKKVPRRDVPPYVARQLRRVVGNGFMEVWGLIDGQADDKQAAFEKFEALLTPKAIGSANLKNGRALYQRTCMACHKLHGEGGTLGPDITGANRNNLDYLLQNILDPSGIIQDDYKMVTITKRDGQTLVGNIATENERQLILSVVGQRVVINKSDIQSREVDPVSMMPEGLLNALTDEESIDLIGYLMKLEAPK